ncbi:hypothetical protein CR513_23965, partial [Mucuna pruriens]
MDDEIHAIDKNETSIGVKWVYKTKYNPNGEIDPCKVRLVAKGYKQKLGIDYFEIFSLVARLDTIRIIIFFLAQINWKIYQMDVKSTFLMIFLEEEVYVEQLHGYLTPRAWYKKIDSYFMQHGFERCSFEHILYVTFVDL